MSEVPLEAFEYDSRSGTQPLPEILSVINRATLIEKAHEVAREYEQMLVTSAVTMDEAKFNEMKADVIKELNATHGYLNETLSVNGIVPFTGANFQEGSDEKGVFPRANYKVTFTDAPVRSLGYTAFATFDQHERTVAIKHYGRLDPTLAGTTDDERIAIYQSGDVYLPIDGSVDIQLQDEHTSSNLKLLEMHIPDIYEDVDVAIYGSDTPTKRLRALSKIDFADSDALTGRGGQLLKEELVKFINQTIQIQQYGLINVAGTKEIVTPIDKGYILGVLEKVRFTGHPKSIDFSPLDDRLILKIDAPVNGQGMQETMVVLNSRISITPAQQLYTSKR